MLDIAQLLDNQMLLPLLLDYSFAPEISRKNQYIAQLLDNHQMILPLLLDSSFVPEISRKNQYVRCFVASVVGMRIY